MRIKYYLYLCGVKFKNMKPHIETVKEEEFWFTNSSVGVEIEIIYEKQN